MAFTKATTITIVLMLVLVGSSSAILELTSNYVNGTADWELKQSDGLRGVKFVANQTGTISLLSVEFKGREGTTTHYTARIFIHDPALNKPDYQVGFIQTKEVSEPGWNTFQPRQDIYLMRGVEYWIMLNCSSDTDYYSLISGTSTEGMDRAMSKDGTTWDLIPNSAFNFRVFTGEITDVDVAEIVTTTAEEQSIAICESEGGTPLKLKNNLFCKINGTYKTIDDMVNQTVEEIEVFGAPTYNIGALIVPKNPQAGWVIFFIIIVVIIMFLNEQRFVSRERQRHRIERSENERAVLEVRRGDRRRRRPDGGYY